MSECLLYYIKDGITRYDKVFVLLKKSDLAYHAAPLERLFVLVSSFPPRTVTVSVAYCL